MVLSSPSRAPSGDDLVLIAAPDAPIANREPVDEADDTDPNVAPDPDAENERTPRKQDRLGSPAEVKPNGGGQSHAPSARSVVHVNITVDSSMDTEKLLKQLELLKRFGAL